jgi:hypothetical protein
MSRGAKETAMASDISEATGRAENATAQIAKLRAQVEALMRIEWRRRWLTRPVARSQRLT